MCGRVLSTLVLLLFATLDAASQCSWTPRYSGQFRTTAFDVSVDADGYLWLATGYGVRLFELGSDGGVLPVASIAVPGNTRSILAGAGGYAYAGSGTRLFVLRRDGHSLSVVRSFDHGAAVNDLAVKGFLFVATANGIAHYDLIDPSHPIRSGTVLPTSSANVTSLAVDRDTLYAADGDASVEIFTVAVPSLPQRTGALESLPRSVAVHATGTGTVFVSDALSTDVFSGSTRLVRVPFGATAFAAGAGDLRFLAGRDSTFRAADFSTASRVAKVYEHRLAPGDGTTNAIQSMAVARGTLYVAAGDIGLVTFDEEAVGHPYPLVSYLSGATSTALAEGDRAWFADAGGKINEYRIDPAGLALVPERTWSGGDVLHDADGTSLASSAGATATVWTLAPQVPSSAMSATFGAEVRRAVVRGTGLVALLSDRSVWTASPTPAPAGVAPADHLVRSGPAILLAELTGEGKTILRYHASGDLAAAPVTVSVDGVAVGGIAFEGTRAALFTFSGINVVDFATSSVSTVAGSSSGIPSHLALSGGAVLALSANEIRVHEDGAFVRAVALPADAVALDVAGAVAVAATAEGPLAAFWGREIPPPAGTLTSAHYTALAAGGTRLALLRKQQIDLFSTAAGLAPHFVIGVDAAGVTDAAVLDGRLYTLSPTGTVRAHSSAGAVLASATVDRGPDAQALTVDAVRGALWVSFSKGCQTGTCVRETVVLDPSSLAVTATMSGSVTDFVTSGTRAWVLTDQPKEMRVLDVTAPLVPVMLKAAAAPPTAGSIGWRPGNVYLLGEQIFAFHDTTLSATGIHLTPVVPGPSPRVRVVGDCGVVTGRGADPELYDARTWDLLGGQVAMPSATRTFVAGPDRLQFLTEHSLEVWSAEPPAPGKRRSAR